MEADMVASIAMDLLWEDMEDMEEEIMEVVSNVVEIPHITIIQTTVCRPIRSIKKYLYQKNVGTVSLCVFERVNSSHLV